MLDYGAGTGKLLAAVAKQLPPGAAVTLVGCDPWVSEPKDWDWQPAASSSSSSGAANGSVTNGGTARAASHGATAPVGISHGGDAPGGTAAHTCFWTQDCNEAAAMHVRPTTSHAHVPATPGCTLCLPPPSPLSRTCCNVTLTCVITGYETMT